ncbi:hypothetical protein AAG570_006969 [Ranatra chinensis]|uniref:Phosphatidylinositol-glycan biosynthesis class F protein n=1 Tax=Ranatra chinensis TaxID=642074 RepID=A0ABD0Z643_9HEMI
MALTKFHGPTLDEIGFFYCISTCVVLTLFSLVLFFNETYLLLGSFSIYPAFLFLGVLELTKWTYSQILHQKDSLIYRNKKLSVILLLWNNLKTSGFKEFFKSIIIVGGSVIVYYILAVLFGAQVLKNFEETFMFSMLLSQLTIFPLCLNVGASDIPHLLSTMESSNAIHSLLIMNIKGTLAGAWLGAIVIPLDWDRPWQEWPIPCSVGAFCGYILSHYVLLIQTFISPTTKFWMPRKKQ